jgi:hypothetical protein
MRSDIICSHSKQVVDTLVERVTIIKNCERRLRFAYTCSQFSTRMLAYKSLILRHIPIVIHNIITP